MSFRAHHKNVNEDRPILSAAKSSPGILVSTKVKFMRIVGGGVSLERGVK